MTIGAMVGPEAFTKVKYLTHYRQGRGREGSACRAIEMQSVRV